MTDAETDALEPGPELDALVAEKVMGWPRFGNSECCFGRPIENAPGVGYLRDDGRHIRVCTQGDENFHYEATVDLWHPSTDANQALEVAAKFSRLTVTREYRDDAGTKDTDAMVELFWPVSGGGYARSSAFSSTLPEAVCKAALKAVRR